MTKESYDESKESLESFLRDYKSFTNRGYYSNEGVKTSLQHRVELISRLITYFQGGIRLVVHNTEVGIRGALEYSLSENIQGGEKTFVENNIVLALNEAIGNIVNKTIPKQDINPVLVIKDEELQKRCLHLLNEKHPLDTVIRESTVILEHRLRGKLAHEKLSEIIPNSVDQTGETLVNKLLSPNEPVIVISEDKSKRIAFHKMMIGIVAYLRNPFHHNLNDKTELSLAWSVVGLIDSILNELENCYIPDELKGKGKGPK